VLAVFFAAAPPDGATRSLTLQFLGRFHLLTVHFPIALIFLVPIFELVGRRLRLPHLRESVDFLLLLAMAASLAAAALGWSLARSGAYQGRLITQHMWGAAAVSALCWLTWILRKRSIDLGYFLTLAATVGLVAWVGYRGGQMTQGENHLTETMPAPLKGLLGIASESTSTAHTSATPNSTYATQVQPIFNAHCTTCHGPDRQKGDLRLDTYEAALHGGKHGAAIKPGDAAASDLIRRIKLPQDASGVMPPEGKKPLAPEEIATLEHWIAQGASPTAAATTTSQPVPAVTRELPAPDPDPTTVAHARAPLATQVAEAQKRLPGILDYESRTSSALVLNAAALAARFTDADLGSLKPLLPEIATADLTGTAITDRSADLLATLRTAHVIKLARTHAGDATAIKLAPLPALETLNLFETEVTPAILQPLSTSGSLKHLYLGGTKIPATASLPDALKGEVIF
jgi:mono/diheme cytochrome c family protein/uncharacterized membrane protein